MARRDMATKEQQSEALAWDDGCHSDTARNHFLIPRIADILMRERPSSILDVGAATGYIPRSLQARLDYLPEWTLLDVDGQRLAIAEHRKPANMRLSLINGSMADAIGPGRLFQAVLVTFTLLETPDAAAMITSAASALARNGLLIIAVPDVWKDVVIAAQQQPRLLEEFLSGSVELPKTDKFTGEPYPFYALRIESLLATALAQLCVLECFECGGEDQEIILLVFRKQALDALGYLCG